MANSRFTLERFRLLLLPHWHDAQLGGPPYSYLVTVAATLAAILALAVVTRVLVQKLYPQPIPGIPYNEGAANNILGDIPDIGEHTKKNQSFRTWFLGQARRHNSAITQVFLGPLSKPAVIVSDYREVNDILSHRDAVDFKRGLKVDAFRGILPHAFPAMETFDPGFHSSRNLARDLMTSSFLHTVNAPRIYDIVCHLLELWRTRSRMAAGRPFDVANDISVFSFDAILSAALGLGPEGGDVQHQHEELLRGHAAPRGPSLVPNGGGDVADDDDVPVSFPQYPRSAKLAALRVDEDSLWKAFVVPWPALYHRINNLRPSVRAARRTMRDYIAAQIARSGPGLADGTREPQSALDFVIQRELRAAAKNKDKDKPKAFLADPRILEPIYGYLIAGHDTSSGSLLWLVRRLASHPEEQARVRESLHATYREAHTQARLPTAAELVRSRAPYLDAFVEETLRCDTPVVNIMAMTRRDTTVLNRRVPADTRVFLNLSGPSLNQPSVAVAEADRRAEQQKQRTSATARQTWDDQEPHEFRPARWLNKDESEFNSAAGPILAFSAGNRGCWGKRLGYLELRMVLALLVWSFEFIDVPGEPANRETYDSLVTAPKHCVIRLREIF
jgi:cytochrome P450